MRYVPIVALLLALVTVMGGLGRESFRATRSIALTIVGFVAVALLFGLVLRRTI